MKRKLIYILLPIILLCACLGFAACGDKGEELPEQLLTPKNLKIEKGILTWDGVEYADGYRVYIDDEEHQTTECRYDLTGLSAEKDHSVKIIAYSNRDAIKDSKRIGINYTAKAILEDKGFAFQKAATSNSYQVTKFGIDEKGACFIPESYNGGKVVSLAPGSRDETVLQIKSLSLPSTINSSVLEPAVGLFGAGNAFKAFKNLEEVELRQGEGSSDYYSEGNCIINRSTNTLVVGTIKSQIPDSVTKIGNYAFAGRNLTEFTVPERITKLGVGAFLECEQLTKITLPEGLTTLNTQMFFACQSLTEVSLPAGIKIIGEYAFSNCASLTSIEVPANVTEIWSGAFTGCTSLKSISLPEGLTSLGNSAFEGCIALTEIVIPESVTSIGSQCFADCTSLTSAIIMGLVSELSQTFNGCTSLKSVVLSPIITVIQGYTFSNCPLETVYYGNTEETWEEYMRVAERGNTTLLAAARYYYSYEEPETEGDFWHFVDGVPTKW